MVWTDLDLTKAVKIIAQYTAYPCKLYTKGTGWKLCRQKMCDGRESNPDLMLGRHQCWPLHHQRLLSKLIFWQSILTILFIKSKDQGSAWFISIKRQPSRNWSSSWTYRLAFWLIRFKSLRQRQESMQYGQATAAYRFRSSFVACRQTRTLKTDRWYLLKGHTNEMKRFEDAIVVHYTPKHVVKPGIRVRKLYTGRYPIRKLQGGTLQGMWVKWPTERPTVYMIRKKLCDIPVRVEELNPFDNCPLYWIKMNFFHLVVLHRRFYSTMSHDSLPKHTKVDQSIQRLDSNPSNFGTR